MSKEVAIPDYLKEMLDSGSLGDSSSLISAGSSVPRLSLKGQRFRFIKDGEEVRKTSDPINVVILGVQPEKGMCKTYYAKGYQPDASDPPDCSSSDGVRPDPWVDNPQSSACANCPHNEWGSAKSMSGKKAKACRDSKRLFIVDPKEGIQDAQGWIANVTVASLRNLSEYGKFLVTNRVPMQVAVTELSLDEDSDFPILKFRFVGILSETHGKAAISRAKVREWAELEYKEAVEEEPSQNAASQTVNTETKQTSEPVTIDGEAKEESSQEPESIDDILSKWE